MARRRSSIRSGGNASFPAATDAALSSSEGFDPRYDNPGFGGGLPGAKPIPKWPDPEPEPEPEPEPAPVEPTEPIRYKDPFGDRYRERYFPGFDPDPEEIERRRQFKLRELENRKQRDRESGYPEEDVTGSRGGRVRWGDYEPGEVLLKFRAGVDEASIHSQYGGTVIDFISSIGLVHVRLAPGTSTAEAILAYRNNPDVEYAEANYRLGIATNEPSDPDSYRIEPWHDERLNPEQRRRAWPRTIVPLPDGSYPSYEEWVQAPSNAGERMQRGKVSREQFESDVAAEIQRDEFESGLDAIRADESARLYGGLYGDLPPEGALPPELQFDAPALQNRNSILGDTAMAYGNQENNFRRNLNDPLGAAQTVRRNIAKDPRAATAPGTRPEASQVFDAAFNGATARPPAVAPAVAPAGAAVGARPPAGQANDLQKIQQAARQFSEQELMVGVENERYANQRLGLTSDLSRRALELKRKMQPGGQRQQQQQQQPQAQMPQMQRGMRPRR